MKEIEAHVDIDAPVAAVWEVLSDLARWHEWNPFIPEAAGIVAEGERMRARIMPPGRKATAFKPTIMKVDPGATFEWLGHLGVPGIFDGRHRFDLEAVDGGTRLRQSERFSGILSGIIHRMIGEATLEGFHLMNAALKARVETASTA